MNVGAGVTYTKVFQENHIMPKVIAVPQVIHTVVFIPKRRLSINSRSISSSFNQK